GVPAPPTGTRLGGFITDTDSRRWVFFINTPVAIVSLSLSQHVLRDPPHLAKVKENPGSIDYVGLGLIAVGLGCLEVVLDKGQQEDWFASRFIVGFAATAAVALIGFVIW